MLLEKEKRDKSFPENGFDKNDEMQRLLDVIDVKIFRDERRLIYHRGLCRYDAHMSRLCDAQAELLGELTRLNWRYRHE